MFSNFLQPLILQPTRFMNSNKPSLIDNIFINSIDIIATSGNLIPKITDHMPNFLLLERKLCKQTKPSIMKRDFTNFDELKYLNDIENLYFSLTTHGGQNLDSCFAAFQNNITDIMEKYAPIKTLSKQQRKQQRKPWITNGILKSISIKNKLYKKFLKSKDTFWYQRYKYYRDTLNHLIRRSKRNHYRSYFETFKNNSKHIWKGVNELINQNKLQIFQRYLSGRQRKYYN